MDEHSLTITIRRPDGDFSYTWNITPEITIGSYCLWVFEKHTSADLMDVIQDAIDCSYPTVINYNPGEDHDGDEDPQICLVRLTGWSECFTSEITIYFDYLDDSF